jgi:hypothetical protein
MVSLTPLPTCCWLVILLLTVTQTATSMPVDCNGLSNLCGVSVKDSYFAMVHNAMAAVENGFAFAANHMDDPVVEALDAGYRGLNLDICNCNGDLQFCHGNDVIGCGVGRLDPMTAFTDINNWIAANPNNVVMITLEINNDADETVTLAMIQQLLQQVPGGFYDRFYDHGPIDSSSTTNEWPTLGDLIESNQQVLFFYFRGPNGNGEHVPGLHYFYDYTRATDFSWESVDELESTLMANCPITRGQSSTGDFFMIEAFVTETVLFGLQFQPSRDAAREINTVEWAGPILDACLDIHGFPATLLSVDFWSEGNLPLLMQQQNALLVGAPTPSSGSPTPAPSFRPTTRAPTLTPATPSPSFMPSLRPTRTMSPTSNETTIIDVCEFETPDGELIVFSRGESYGDNLTPRCDGPEAFPCFCNPDLPGQIECPYCGFPTQDETGSPILYCARHNETIEYVDGSIAKTCSCEIPENPLEDSISTCEEAPLPSPAPTTTSNSESPDLLVAPSTPPSPQVSGVQEPTPSSAVPTSCSMTLLFLIGSMSLLLAVLSV